MDALMHVAVGACALFALQSVTSAQAALEISETQYLLAPDVNPYQEFGASVSVDGDTLVVGSPGDEDFGLSSGSAYVFVRSGGAWVFQQKLHSSAPNTSWRFGSSVSVSGDVLIVGEPKRAIPQATAAALGSAHVYRRSGTTWNFEAELRAPDERYFWNFGEGVAAQGERVIVGAPERGANDTTATQWDDHGSAYVFDHVGNAWTLTSTVRASEGTNDDFFGATVALSGNTLAVGAPSHNGTAAAYVYVDDGNGSYAQQAILQAPNLGGGSAWVDSLALDGDVIATGNWKFGLPFTYTGRVAVWRRTGTTWSFEGALDPGNVPAYTSFGRSVAVHGDRLAVGATGVANSGLTLLPGQVSIFVHHAGRWTLESRFEVGDGTYEDELGIALAWSGDELVSGAWHRWEWGIRSGAVYACDLALRARTYCQSLPNSAGPGAWIGVSGSLSTSANDFTLTCGGLPPGSIGKFFYGTTQASAPFGNGLRCVGGTTFRLLPHLAADASGTVARVIDFTQAPTGIGPGALTPGSTWNFQYWHRNAAGGGAGFNLSDAIAVTFAP